MTLADAPTPEEPRLARISFVKAMAHRTMKDMSDHKLAPEYGETGASILGRVLEAGYPVPLGFNAAAEVCGVALEEQRAHRGMA